MELFISTADLLNIHVRVHRGASYGRAFYRTRRVAVAINHKHSVRDTFNMSLERRASYGRASYSTRKTQSRSTKVLYARLSLRDRPLCFYWGGLPFLGLANNFFLKSKNAYQTIFLITFCNETNFL